MAVIDENRRGADDRIRSVTPLRGRNIEVFDLEVEDVHRFAVTSLGVAHGAIVGSFAGGGEILR